ncbi:uncharacterized protein LOC135689232 [Rhopilema esculentum]|uniref:uncharacterized protein LOC135689232 n=1 Tax=Rhopilema esculentum TaxID=499914 RepID=UPI0031D20339
MISHDQDKAIDISLDMVKSLFVLPSSDKEDSKVKSKDSFNNSTISEPLTEEFLLSSFGGMFSSSEFSSWPDSNGIGTDKETKNVSSYSKGKKKNVKFKKGIDIIGQDARKKNPASKKNLKKVDGTAHLPRNGNKASKSSSNKQINTSKDKEQNKTSQEIKSKVKLTEVEDNCDFSVADDDFSDDSCALVIDDNKLLDVVDFQTVNTPILNEIAISIPGKGQAEKEFSNMQSREVSKAKSAEKVISDFKRKRDHVKPKMQKRDEKKVCVDSVNSVCKGEMVDLETIKPLVKCPVFEEAVSKDSSFFLNEDHNDNKKDSSVTACEPSGLIGSHQTKCNDTKHVPVSTYEGSMMSCVDRDDVFAILSSEVVTDAVIISDSDVDDELPLIQLKKDKSVEKSFAHERKALKDRSDMERSENELDRLTYKEVTPKISSSLQQAENVLYNSKKQTSQSEESLPSDYKSNFDLLKHLVGSTSTSNLFPIVTDTCILPVVNEAAFITTACGNKVPLQNSSYFKQNITSSCQSDSIPRGSVVTRTQLTGIQTVTTASRTEHDDKYFSCKSQVSSLSTEQYVPVRKKQKFTNTFDQKLNETRTMPTDHLLSTSKIIQRAEGQNFKVLREEVDSTDVSWSVKAPILSEVNASSKMNHPEVFSHREHEFNSSVSDSRFGNISNPDFSDLKKGPCQSDLHLRQTLTQKIPASSNVFLTDSSHNSSYKFEAQNWIKDTRTMPELISTSNMHTQTQSSNQASYDLLIGIKNQLNQIQKNVDTLQQDYMRFKKDFYSEKCQTSSGLAPKNTGLDEIHLESSNNGICLSAPGQHMPKITLRGIKNIIIDGGD